MKKKILALIMALITAGSLVAFGGCEFPLDLGFGSQTGSDNDGDTDVFGDDSTYDDTQSDEEDSSDTNTDTDTDDGCEEHEDEDNDSFCDVCKEYVMRDVDIFAINDLHGKVLDGDGHIGVDELTTYFKQAKEDNPNTFFLSTGDMWQGAAASNLTKGGMVNDWMNEVGFVSMTLGNHEYDWGEEYIIANKNAANFPFLAINIYDKSTGRRVEYCDASVMYETEEGVKVGIIGAMGDCYSSISSDKVADVTFKTGNVLTALVKAEANSLREQGADIIVYSMHDDMDNYDEALSDGYVDIVFEGHSHQSYAQKDSKGIWHVQGGGDNDGISRAKISVNIANEKHSVKSATTVRTSSYSSCAKDPIIEELTQKYSEQINQANRVVGYTDSYRSSTAICNKVADLYLELGEKTWGDEYDIVLGGAYLKTRDPYDLQKGKVCYGDLLNILPFDNQIVLCAISGSKLRTQFINNTNSAYRITLADGFDVSKVEETKTYYIVTDTYTSLYSYNGCTEVARYDETTFARDLMADFLATGAWGVDPNPTPTPNPDDSSSSSSGNIDTDTDSGNGDEDSIYTPIADLLAAGKTLGSNQESAEYYYVKGTVTQITDTSKGIMYIKDGSGSTLYIYRLYDANGNRYGAMSEKPVVGDTIVVYDSLFNYNGNTLEFKDATLIEIVGADDNSGGNSDLDENDPYADVSKAEFYLNYTPATSAEDAYYRTLHGFMSGELTVPDQAPTIAENQPTQKDMLVRNTEFWFEDDGKTYIVVDAQGQEAFRIYKDGAYITLEEVAAYVYAFGTYPANYTVSKKTSPTSSIWGEYLRVNHTQFSGNTTNYPYEPELPNITGCDGKLQYYEMDIGTTGTDCDPSYPAKLYNNGTSITRGAARIVYGKQDLNGNGTYDVGEIYVFYTYNHYNDFQEYLNYAGGWGKMFGNITGGGTISSDNDYNPTDYVEVYWGSL